MPKMIASGFHVVLFLMATFILVAAEIKDKGWWKHTVFYQIYPRSFKDGNGDGIGDLLGIIDKLEYLVESGVGAICLSPIYSSPMKDYGYDVKNFTEIDRDYGTMADFRVLLKKAKELKLKVILDFVPNHTSDQHEWFQGALQGNKYTQFYVWHDNPKGKVPNNWLSVYNGSAWTYKDLVGRWYLHQFFPEQPDLNYENFDVKREMLAILTFWLEEGVDGFRIHAVPYLYEDLYKFRNEPRSEVKDAEDCNYASLRHVYTTDLSDSYDLVKSWKRLVDDFADKYAVSEKVILTEGYSTFENTAKFYQWGSDVPFNFNFITNATAESNAVDFKKIIDYWMHLTEIYQGTANWVMGNHDWSRVASRFKDRVDQMTMLKMILPGVAVTYYGEEIGMLDNMDISSEESVKTCTVGEGNYLTRSRKPYRTPFQWDDTANAGFTSATPWLPVNKNYKELNLEIQKNANESHYKVYKSLTALRNSSTALRQGFLHTLVQNDNKTLAVIRKAEAQEGVVLVINFSDDKNLVVNLSFEFSRMLKVNVTSVGCAVPIGTIVNPNSILIPAKASMVLITNNRMDASDGDSPNSVPETRTCEIITVIVVLFTLLILRT